MSAGNRSRAVVAFLIAATTIILSSFAATPARASDALGAASIGAQASRRAESWYFGSTIGTRGISYAQGKGSVWYFGSGNGFALRQGAFGGFTSYELGLAKRLVDQRWATVWAGGSVLGSARAGLSIGARGIAGAALHFGNEWFVRPGVTLSFGGAAGTTGSALLTPADAFVEAGWHYAGFQPYVRAAVGVDPFAGVLPTWRAEVSIGFAFTWTAEVAREVEAMVTGGRSGIRP